MRPLAITGAAAVSPFGVGREAFLAAMRDPQAARRRAFGTPTVLDPQRVPGARAAECWDFDARQWLGDKGLRNLDRLTRMMIVASRLALEDAGIKRNGAFVAHGPGRVGMCSSTAYGSLDAITELNLVAELEDPRYINPARFPNTVINAAAGYVSIWEDLRAPNVTIVDGNCGALDAVLSAETHLSHGRADAFVVGGAEVLSEPLYLAFRKLGVLPPEGEPERMWLGEGAAYAVVEPEAVARERGARVLARILGYGTAYEPPPSDALLVHTSPEAVRRAIVAALADAGVPHRRVDAVVSAENGLERHDAAVRAGIESALGRGPIVAAPKRLTGETFGASGAFGVAHALCWMYGAPVAPVADGGAPLLRRIDVVVVTAVGFYGNASAIVLARG
ncbi:MAG: hypothetical protein NZ898_08555 [Myxococcota bacterium]|nr:hypothetical protein [Myxococcota bacterium]MDW8363994.1 beta-ketoacyl synthase N-terminal-like domain-containing protein [Myxococcales bacterium]